VTPRPPPIPPRPDLLRRPPGAFGWLDARLLTEDWLADLGAEATALLVLLALAADRRGASFYGRERMARALSLPRRDVDRALARLVQLRLVAHRPWRDGHPDGVWQIMPLPPRGPHRPSPPTGQPAPIADLLRSLGFQPPTAE
jgi:hypothetical protein